MKLGQHILSHALALSLLTACSGTDGSAQAPGSQDVASIKEQIKVLEESGEFPKLDRSTGITGSDINNNGIRDDIDYWIAALPITDVQKKAVEQEARMMQKMLLINLSQKTELTGIAVLAERSIRCLSMVFKPDYQKGYDLSSQIEAITANTRERAKQYIAFNRAMSGSVSSSVNGDTCDK